ncbi:MAG: UDP-N-acetylmuramoyl-tripeptide--D-alanyl-D-alanine ligase [Eubacteriales bacterium]|nr:UDP-N-acetylmuramoyl-tripeptide--D-alanyl-D-alanine ligase [Eubacteriales bacterium]
MKLKVSEIIKAVDGRLVSGSEDTLVCNITTASNLIKGEDLFVPIKGERTDGHKYIVSAFENGAVASFTEYEDVAAVDGKPVPEGKAVILVKDSLNALLTLGTYVREKYAKIPFVGVTGSVGKTTLREMIACALSAKYRVYSTKGNANSQVGVPITVFDTDPEAEIAVVELGISEFGEMEQIAPVAKVDTAVFTNIGICHLAQLKTQENILSEKMKILMGTPDGGNLVLNGEDKMLQGYDPKRDINVYYYEKADIPLSVEGDHMKLNAGAALKVAELYGVDLEAAKEKLKEFKALKGRGERIEKDGITFIDDCYNASPVSMKAALNVLSGIKAEGRKIAVLGNMHELGPEELRLHSEIGEYIDSLNVKPDVVLTYGELAKSIAENIKSEGITVKSFERGCLEELKKELYGMVNKGDVVLLKGSNSLKMGELLK